MKILTSIASAFLVILLFNSNSGCDSVELMDIPDSSSGIVPIYVNNLDWQAYSLLPQQNIQHPATRVSRGGFAYYSGPNSGVNITDQSKGYQHSIGFIAIPKMHSMEISIDTLYVGNYVDRLAFSIKDPYHITFISREESYYPDADPLSLPFGYEGYFECPDLSNGVILTWERDNIDNPTCWK